MEDPRGEAKDSVLDQAPGKFPIFLQSPWQDKF